MPPLPSIANVLRVDLQWTDSSDTSVITRQFFRYSGGPPTSTDCVALAADIYSPAAAMHAQWDPATSLTGVKVTDLSSVTGGVGEHFQSTAGTSTQGTLSAGASVLVNYVIARRYRGGKPRSYLPWFGPGDLDTRQTWDAGSLSGATSALAAYFAAVIGSTAGSTTITEHVNVSYYSGFTAVENPITHRWKNVSNPRSTPVVDNIQSWAIAGHVASQRRRNKA